MNRYRLITSCLTAFLLTACGPDDNGPTVVPNINGSWLVALDFSVSLDGDWMCAVEESTFTFTQISDTFTGTVEGGAANCESVTAEMDTVSFDGNRIFNGVIDPVGNLAFNVASVENLNQGLISADRNTITGTASWALVLTPGIAVFFFGSWTATRI